MIESDAMRVLVSQVEAMNFQLYEAQRQILGLHRMDINLSRLIFMMTMIMLMEAVTIAFLTWRVCWVEK